MTDQAAQNSVTLTPGLRAALFILAAVASVWLLKTGTAVLLPLILAVTLGIVFAPMADAFNRAGAPPVAGAMAVLVIVLSAIVLGVFLLYPVVAEFILRVPILWNEVQDAFSGLKSTMQSVGDVQEEVAQTLDPDNTGEISAGGGVQVPGMHDILAYVPSVAAQIMIFVGVLYFFLLTRTELYAFIERSSAALSGAALYRAEREVSRYFLSITAINAGFGCLVALMLSAIGMPNPVYWGVAAFLVNYVLYLGPIAFALVLTAGGIIVFDGPMSFAPPVLYMMMNMTEGQFVTPSLVGRHMKVNPLLIFLSLVFWVWVWGPLGGLIAIPILVWLRQISKALDTGRTEMTAPVHRTGGERCEPEAIHGPAE
ncbi:AI-2E family transporter [uncultured Roseobacter sp.]|uniref:AI-2E family transporter n=1 Tax=uncultured Roseobacter sp. TaxID=114847 RepID=UPI002601AAD5|nr:AI-2E family transporter [uncultured Roseobacter sp.]